MSCLHRNGHNAAASIVFLADTESFRAELKIFCAECGVPFRFKGLKAGFHPMLPSTDGPGYELRLPIEPGDLDGPVPDHYKANA